MRIGSRVSVRDQNISGTIVRWDGTKAVVLDDDRADWMEQGDDGTLVFDVADLETDTEESTQMTDNVDHYAEYRELSSRLAVHQANLHKLLDSIDQAERSLAWDRQQVETTRQIMRAYTSQMAKHAEFML